MQDQGFFFIAPAKTLEALGLASQVYDQFLSVPIPLQIMPQPVYKAHWFLRSGCLAHDPRHHEGPALSASFASISFSPKGNQAGGFAQASTSICHFRMSCPTLPETIGIVWRTRQTGLLG
jgi:hypothetical protein